MAAQSSKLSIEQLPDDVLLEIMRHLGRQDIFTCRLVCKKLGALALHPDVWRQRGLHLQFPSEFVWACPVLRLAPCLDWLVAELPTEGCQLAYTITRCAVSCLNLDVQPSGSTHAAAMIRNQEALGRLRDLEVSMPPSPSAVLLGTTALASGLEKLTVTGIVHCAPNTMASVLQHRAACTPSLKYFSCERSTSEADPFVHFVLATHAATLEDVNLDSCCHSDERGCPYSAATVPLLAEIVNLRSLECPLLPGLEALAARESLTTLIINVCESPERPAVMGAWQLLRRAKQLRDVTLIYMAPLDSGVADVGGEPLVRALVSSGPSRLESLTMVTTGSFDSPEQRLSLLRPVLGVLPSLPALRTLHLDDVSDELLSGITPDAVPALERLVLRPLGAARPVPRHCAHAWLHKDAVKKLSIGIPSLQFLVVPSVPKNCPGDRLCDACALDCDCDVRQWVIKDSQVGSGVGCYPCTLMQRNKCE
ncbi:uncharacterized protein LOC113207335 [Frankliniella occidentalis]|uniref:Uncharacterized protein LOC113207335 n=1 Tax=Frankliniella occidentalis TaxID=133901 RepID=A0A6J1SF58_FRAOC|nr:uncharacterized protein LOC113207335 [Frankliniella occidentalis]